MREKKTKSLKDNVDFNLHDDYCDYVLGVSCDCFKVEGTLEILVDHVKGLANKDPTTRGCCIIVDEKEVGHHLETCMKADYFKKLGGAYFMLLTVRLKRVGLTPMGLNEIVHVKFDIAGGKRHLGEASVACAKRELEEETHITLDADLYNGAAIYNDDDQTGTYYYIDISDTRL